MIVLRIGIMGGTFDPIHSGHISISMQTMRALSLDKVMLLPDGDPPHKRAASKYDRLEMCRLAALGQDGLFVSDEEVKRNGVTYTVETLTALCLQHPDVSWYYIIGADTLDVLDTWRCIEKVARMCTFAVCGRADDPGSMEIMRRLHREIGANFIRTDVTGPDISSTDIRNRRRTGKDIAGLVPEKVARHIKRRGLYLCNMSRTEILRALDRRLKPARYVHTLGVAATARQLAPRYGVEVGKADIAALLHDCAKSMRLDDMRNLITASALDVDAEELASDNVIHAPAGCILAEREFGVHDPEILSAIRRHTLGGADMTALEKLIYVCDCVEPGRTDFPGLSEARQLAQEDLNAAECKCASLTVNHLRTLGLQPHRMTLEVLKS